MLLPKTSPGLSDWRRQSSTAQFEDNTANGMSHRRAWYLRQALQLCQVGWGQLAEKLLRDGRLLTHARALTQRLAPLAVLYRLLLLQLMLLQLVHELQLHQHTNRP